MGGRGRVVGDDFRGCEVESKSVGARRKMDQRLEVGITNWPIGRWEAVLVMTDCEIAVKGMLCGIGNLAIDEEDLLVDLVEL